MKIYFGVGSGPGPRLIEVLGSRDGAGREARPYPLRHFVRHSPDGFQWGYAGSGPADAARCILIDCVGVDLADRFYQRFKQDFIAPAGDRLYITEAEIREWLEDQAGYYG